MSHKNNVVQPHESSPIFLSKFSVNQEETLPLSSVLKWKCIATYYHNFSRDDSLTVWWISVLRPSLLNCLLYVLFFDHEDGGDAVL